LYIGSGSATSGLFWGANNQPVSGASSTTANVASYATTAAYTTNQTFYPLFSNLVTVGNTTHGVATTLSFNPGAGSGTLNTGTVIVATINAATLGNTGANVIGNAHWGAGAFTTANISTSLAPTANLTINSGSPTAYWGTTWSGNIVSNTQLISAATVSSSNVTGALVVNGGVGIGSNVYVGNRVGFVWAANNVSSAYTVFNNTLNSIDTVFG
jgi:hypothetical protein